AFSSWQNDLIQLLMDKGLPREDIFSVMLVLTKEEKGQKMMSFLKESETLTPDDICKRAGEIAFEENC
ncbi:MAG: hypothetical protein IKT50_06010, partial [Clostridia bacterium]|nr:hypothetical protein [Clostridia bacterium]